MLIILPDHLCVSGVTTWALRAIKGLRERSIPAGLIVHTPPGESPPQFLQPYIAATVRNAPSIHHLRGCLDPLVAVYLHAIQEMYAITGKPVIISPNLHGDCYGAIATIAQNHPNLVRVASWIHSDNEYDIAVAKRYEPMIHAIVPVSSELYSIAERAIPGRIRDIFHIPYCVEVPPHCPARLPMERRALRLVYTGRLHEQQKRVSVLPHLADALRDRGIDFEFRIVGDGPEKEKLLQAIASNDHVEYIGTVPPEEIPEHLRWADLWILPSRYEGQSVAMLEALSLGCIPVVTKVRSGASDAVINGHTGMSVDTQWNTPTQLIASRLCGAIISLMKMDMPAIARNAHLLALKNHSIPTHIDKLVALIDRTTSRPDRPWPNHLRPSYSAKAAELDGSTPPDAAQRMKTMLESLAGKKVLIFCSGQHTKDISKTINDSPAQIIGIVDDDPSKAGTGLIGYPIYPSGMIPKLGATDLVISSWIYEDTIWSKKETIESMGVRLHRLYPTQNTPPSEIVRAALQEP